MENKYLKYQALSIFIVAIGLCLFVASAFQYQNHSFFYYLLLSRIFLVGLGLILSYLTFSNTIQNPRVDQLYFLTCLFIQVTHGVLEGHQSIDFYNFVGVWMLLSSLVTHQTFESWKKSIFPIHLIAFIIPLFFKHSDYFVSLSKFVDNFSLPIAGIILGFLIAKTNSEKFEILSENIDLQKKLNFALNQNLNNEVRFRQKVEVELEKVKQEIENSAKLKAIYHLAQQVSHDIRSPLTALNMTIAILKDIPEQQRVTLRSSVNRINDIANTLLTNAKANKELSETTFNSDSTAEANKSLRLEIELLPALIDTLISEKRVQFRDKINVEIEADFRNSYGAFVKINSTEMSRLLSNIINNSVEAFTNETGKFLLSIHIDNQNVILTAKDNGKGIPAHILEKLGQIGVSHGKEGTQSGSGLGVYHAKKTIEVFGGQFQIASTPGQGTTITMTLPLADKPKWFVEKIKISENSQVISLDDDLSIHNIWKGRFQSLNFSNHNINHLTFTSGPEFKDWFGNREISQSKNISSQVYLVDYELINQKQTGLDIIEELGIGPQSILVTSRYEEPAIKQRCERLGVQLIPKAMAGLVPIEIQEPQIKLDAILIDDDELMGYVWRETAKMSNKTFQWFADPKVFIENKNKFDPTTPIYIDVSLANKVKGQDVAIQLHQLGFTNLHLATGYQPDQIEVPSIIKSVIGKDSPL